MPVVSGLPGSDEERAPQHDKWADRAEDDEGEEDDGDEVSAGPCKVGQRRCCGIDLGSARPCCNLRTAETAASGRAVEPAR